MNSTTSADVKKAITVDDDIHLKNKPLVMMGPSGVGKGTLNHKLRKKYDQHFSTSVSHTTRAMREGEVDGEHYHFVSRDEILGDIERGLFVEHADVHGNIYGTSIKAIQNVAQQGKICVLEIDIQGALSISERDDLDCHFLYIQPPSRDALLERLLKRNSETKEMIDVRLETADVEKERIKECSLPVEFIVNDNLETAFDELVLKMEKFYPHLMKD